MYNIYNVIKKEFKQKILKKTKLGKFFEDAR